MRLSAGVSVGLLAALFLSPAHAQPQGPGSQSETHRLQSDHVGDDYIIDVHLPASYETGVNDFPVLVVLDADKSSGMARDIVDWLSWSQEIPQLIVVGISYGGSVRQWWQKRSRDYTPTRDSTKIWGEWPLAGGAEAFKAFLREELFPFIEGRFRASRDRTLAGLSFGGLFAAYTLFSEPSLFNRYIIAGPALAWDNEIIWEYEQQYRSQHSRLDARVFTAVGGLDESMILEPWERFNGLVASRGYEGLSWLSHRFEGETHISTWPAAFSRGLKSVFAER